MLLRQCLCLFFGVGLVLGCVSVTVQPPPASQAPAVVAPSPPGPLGELNLLFREAYRVRREALEKEASPVVVVSGDDLTLHRGGATETVRVIPDLYHQLKAVAHVPFTLYLLLEPFADSSKGPLPAETTTRLGELRAKIAAARPVVAAADLSPAQRVRQGEILGASDELLAAVLHDGRVSGEDLRAFTWAIAPRMLANSAEAAAAQIEGTHRQMMRWKEAMSCDEWRRLSVVNRARHQSRYGSAATQYFAWLTGEAGPSWAYPGESMRVIYGESLGKNEDALDLLGTVLLDAKASEAFFGDPWRLSRDILIDGTADRIQLLPEADRECGVASSPSCRQMLPCFVPSALEEGAL